MPATACSRIWALAPTASRAEIWSTALMLVDPSGIPALIAGDPDITEVYADMNGKIARFEGFPVA
jgi:thiamine biosynthesis lipoprotein ApbE